MTLADALTDLRDEVAATAFPLDLPSAGPARRRAVSAVEQLDDYLLPRLTRLDAPLLVVVGGSTGSGKSTLVNSLVQAVVTPTGILRPTTRGPVLVCHPDDAEWFTQANLLPTMVRVLDEAGQPDALRLVESTALTPGLAVLDAPDIDSVVEANRLLAEQLLAAADLWLFVTSAARYADAVPWDFLRTAQVRGTAVALVLDRVPAGGADIVADHLAEMLTAHALGDSPLFVVAEQTEAAGLLPPEAVEPITRWLSQLANDAAARNAVIRQTLSGAIRALDDDVGTLADAAEEQASTARALGRSVESAYADAAASVETGISDGSLLRGEVLARWQQLVGTGELLRGLQARVGRLRDKLYSTVTGRPTPSDGVKEALESGVVALIRGAAGDGAERAGTDWLARPAGAVLLREYPDLTSSSTEVTERAHRLVRDWQRDVLEMVKAEAGQKAVAARMGAYAVNGLGLAVMVAVFAATAFIPTGAEVAVAGGTTLAAQKVLEAIFGDQAVRTLAQRARVMLLERADALLASDANRFRSVLAAQHIDDSSPARLRSAAATVRSVRFEVAP